MANTNCLEGIACPQCKQEDVFEIQATTWAKVTDDGTDQLNDTEWDDDSSIVCWRCRHTGTVAQFRVPTKPIWVVVWTWYEPDGTKIRSSFRSLISQDDAHDIFAQEVSRHGTDAGKVVTRMVEVMVPQGSTQEQIGTRLAEDMDALENRLPALREHTITAEDTDDNPDDIVAVKFDVLRAVISCPHHIVVLDQDSDGPVHVYVDGHGFGTISMEKED